MRIILALGVILGGVHLGTNAIRQVDQMQSDKMDQICAIDPSYCTE